MRLRRIRLGFVALATLMLGSGAADAMAQSSSMRASPRQIRDAMWIRALQMRSAGGGMQNGGPQYGPQYGPLGGGMMGAPLFDPNTPMAADKEKAKAEQKAAAAKKADFEAERAERKRKTQERAEKRKAEAAARRAANAKPAAPAMP